MVPDNFQSIPAATADDLANFADWVDGRSNLVTDSTVGRVAAHYARRAAEAERLFGRIVGYPSSTLPPAIFNEARKFLEAK